MSVLWSLGGGTVAQVRNELNDYEWVPSYTTILAQLRALCRKGWARAERGEKAHRFVPIISQQDAAACAVRELVRRYYGGDIRMLREALSLPRYGSTRKS